MNERDEYLKMLKTGGKSHYTVDSYRKDIDKFILFFGLSSANEIDRLTQTDYRNFISSLDNLSANSINGVIRNLSIFINWLVDNEYIEKNVLNDVKFGKKRFIKVVKKQIWYLDDEESTDLINSGMNKQEKVMLAIMIFCGLRRQEICDIKLSDIHDNVIEVFGKGSRRRKAFLSDDLQKMIDDYVETERNCNTEYLFYGTRYDGPNVKMTGTAVNNRVKRCGKKAGIDSEKLEKLTAHKTRHTFCTNMIKEFDIFTASKAMGHSDISTTRRYDNSGDEVVKKAMLGQRQLNVFGKDK